MENKNIEAEIQEEELEAVETEETVDTAETAETVETVEKEEITIDSEEDYKQKYDELHSKYYRQLAEFDNFRKRTAKEKSSMYDDGVRDTVEKVLPVLDNFERALQSVENQDGFYKGVEMILQQFRSCLEELGIEHIPAEGESFNPTLHYAVGHIEDEKYDENIVFEELQKGYKYKERVIRPAMVKVAN